MSAIPSHFQLDLQQQRDHLNRVSKPVLQRKLNKRRHASVDLDNNFGGDNSDETAPRSSGKFSVKPRLQRYHNLRFKKQRNPEVFGQQLPLNRIIETLDKQSLQELITTLVSNHPQLANDVIHSSPKVTIENSLKILDDKVQLILDNMPYKVSPTSDYSFLRVKTYVDDFFQALSDYTLNFIPPVENDLTICIQFLVEFLTQIFHKLPQFQAVEFRYYYKLTTEKFNHIFNELVSQFINEKKQNILLIINNNWLENFKKLNELNNREFNKVYQYLQEEIDMYARSGSVILDNSSVPSSAVGDSSQDAEISRFGNTGGNGGSSAGSTTDSFRLQGLESILNFSNDNSPLHSNTLSNVYDAI